MNEPKDPEAAETVQTRETPVVDPAAICSRPIDLKNVVCPQCGKPFRLTWDADGGEKDTLRLRGCPSGGIYDVSIECPHCDYAEAL